MTDENKSPSEEQERLEAQQALISECESVAVRRTVAALSKLSDEEFAEATSLASSVRAI
jgi:hypothetical protein